MDQTTLVKSDRVIEAQILAAFRRAHIPVTMCKWNYVPQLEEWQLIIATPWHDSKGPRTTYRAVVGALEKAGIYQRVPMRRVFLKSPDDPLVKALKEQIDTQLQGPVHIVRLIWNGNTQYSLVFAPVTRNGVPVKPFSSLAALKSFLEDDLHINAGSIQSALDEMTHTGAGSIDPVFLTKTQAKGLELV
jgi:hypothetical protein